MPLRAPYHRLLHLARRVVNRLGLNVARSDDYYSPLPLVAELEKTAARWNRPSELVGVRYDLDAMEQQLRQLMASYAPEYAQLPSYEECKQLGYGPGFTTVDALLTFCMLRHLKPARYLEIGSGLSTYYAWQAALRNREDGAPCELTCIDPYAGPNLARLQGVQLVRRPVQDVEPEFFAQLQAGDVLFIDSTHVVKLDGDVPYLYLEVVPRLNPGVTIHSHDIHFPYNVPHPAEQYIFRAKWPRFWTEAMLLQAFLAYNRDFQLLLAPPLLRHYREEVLREVIPGYRPVVAGDYDTHFGSVWYRRVSEE